MHYDKKYFQNLLDHPVWGPEIRRISDLDENLNSHPALVGGAVRDIILGRELADLDISTAFSDTAGVLAKAFAESSGRRLVEYSHHQTIYRVVAPGAPIIDFTDPVGGSRFSDLKRRDFTINSMAIDLSGENSGELIDPLNGLDDLKNSLIRMNDPSVFDEDPLRMLRAFRFKAELNFGIDEKTYAAISERPRLLRKTAGERIQVELLGILEPDGAADRIIDLDSCGILNVILPELCMQKGVEQNAYHHYDVWDHTMEVVRIFEELLKLEHPALLPYKNQLSEYISYNYPSGHFRKSLMKLAALTHDIAKRHCKGVREDGRITFIGHERLGSEMMKEHLDKLKFPGYERDFICDIVHGHLRPAMITHENNSCPKTAYRFFRDFEDSAVAILILSLADRAAAQGELVTDEINEKHTDSVKYLLECLYEKTDIVVRPPQLIDGGTLIHKLEIQPGPIIGHLLTRVQEAQVMGEINSQDEAIEYCRQIVKEEI